MCSTAWEHKECYKIWAHSMTASGKLPTFLVPSNHPHEGRFYYPWINTKGYLAPFEQQHGAVQAVLPAQSSRQAPGRARLSLKRSFRAPAALPWLWSAEVTAGTASSSSGAAPQAPLQPGAQGSHPLHITKYRSIALNCSASSWTPQLSNQYSIEQ